MDDRDPMSDDRDLRARFSALRDAETARAPDFTTMVAHARAARRAPRWWRVSGVAGGLVAAAAAALVLVMPDEDREFDALVTSFAMTSEWTSPTDGLLRSPGDDLLRTVPGIGPTTASPTSGDPLSDDTI